MKRIFQAIAAAALTGTVAALLVAAGCGPTTDRHQAVFVLIDTSGTYTREMGKAQLVINYTLGKLNPGDTLAIGRVKSRSFSEKEILAKVTLDRDPLAANRQKQEFSTEFSHFVSSTRNTGGSAYTDITGGLIQAAEFLGETGAGQKMIIIFSDLQEELGKGTVRDIPIKLNGIRVIALNVTKLDEDNADPRRYLGRIEWWKKRVLAAGATDWRVINDMQRLERIFEEERRG